MINIMVEMIMASVINMVTAINSLEITSIQTMVTMIIRDHHKVMVLMNNITAETFHNSLIRKENIPRNQNMATDHQNIAIAIVHQNIAIVHQNIAMAIVHQNIAMAIVHQNVTIVHQNVTVDDIKVTVEAHTRVLRIKTFHQIIKLLTLMLMEAMVDPNPFKHHQ